MLNAGFDTYLNEKKNPGVLENETFKFYSW